MVPPVDISRFEQLKASGDLPSPKGVALAIMRLTLQDDVSVAELAQVIRTDPAFVGRLIKAANGLLGYGGRPIVSVQDALTVLGMPAVRNMALGFSLLGSYRSGGCEKFNYGHYWSSSVLAAVATQAVTLRTRVAAPDETYCLGLLCRIGELALATLYPHDYSKILENAGKDRQRLLELETRAFAMTNAELGAAMLADWGLPRLFTDAAFNAATGAESMQPEGSRDAILTQTLGLARYLGELVAAPEDERGPILHRMRLCGSRLAIDEASLEVLSDGALNEWREWGALLDVHTEKMPRFEHLSKALEIRAKESLVVSEAAGAGNGDDDKLPLRILVAEGNSAIRESLVRILTEGGYEVSEAEDGYTATEMALEFSPEMMFVGTDFSDIGSLDLLRTLRKTRAGRSIYVVSVLSDAAENRAITAFEAGADELLSLPVSAHLLLAKVKTARRLAVLHNEIEREREEIRHFSAELAVSNRRLQEVALVDPLTGLPSRRLFEDRLVQEWAVSTRGVRPLSCLIISVDGFKACSGADGSEVGDSVLRQVAVAIRSALRGQDMVARMRDDVFAVLCPDTAIEAAVVCGDRVLSGVLGAKISSGSLPLEVSVSIGVASRDERMLDADNLLKDAQQSVFLARQRGANQVAAIQLRPRAA